MGRAGARKATVLVSIAVLTAVLSGCATPDRPFVQLPLELRVIHVESSRANIPVTQFTGPLPGQVETKAVPGMMEAIAVIAQAVSDCFKWGFQSAASQARNANQHGFISVDVNPMGIPEGAGAVCADVGHVLEVPRQAPDGDPYVPSER